MSALLALCLAASPWAAPRTLVFGGHESWILWDVQQARSTPLKMPEELRVEQAVSTANGKTLFLAAATKTGTKTALFKWEPSKSDSLVRLGPTEGFHGQLSLSRDEKWLFFVHHPDGAPPGKHMDKAFAQLHRIRVDGTQHEQLTDTEGCKLASCPLRGSQQLVIHADCAGASRLEMVDASTKATSAAPMEGGRFSELDVAPDARTVLIATSAVQGARILEWSTDRHELRVAAELGFGTVTQPHYGRTKNELLYWDGAAVQRVDIATTLAGSTGSAK